MVVQFLENEIDRKGLKKSYIAKQIGVSPALLTKFFNHNECELDKVFLLIDYLSEDNSEELKSSYIKSYVTSPRNILISLEYANMFNNLDLFTYLIDKHSDNKNREVQEMIRLQKIYMKMNDEFNCYDLLEQIKRVSTSTILTSLFKNILICYCYNRNKNHNIIQEYLDEVKVLVNQMEDCFLKQSYSIRYYQLLGHIELRSNVNCIKAREIGNYLVDHSLNDKIKAYGYYLIGLSYIFDDLEKCQKFMLKSIEIYDEYGKINDAKIILNKLSIVLSLNQNFTMVNSKYAKGLQDIYLNRDLSIDLSNDTDPFAYLVLGIKDSSFNLLMKSLVGFINFGDKLFAEVVKRQMRLIGYSYDFIDDLINIDK